MLPHSYQLPAAIFFVLGGALSCFAGYRLFRVVLGLYGFILGAMFASSMMGTTNTVGMLAAAIIGGLAGAAILVFAYFIGIALVGAGLGALVAHVAWPQAGTGDPPAMLVIVLAIAGAIAAMFLQRYVIIVVDGVRRRVDDHRGRTGDRRRSRRCARRVERRRLGALSVEAGAWAGVGADCVDRARADRHGRAARHHGYEARVIRDQGSL